MVSETQAWKDVGGDGDDISSKETVLGSDGDESIRVYLEIVLHVEAVEVLEDCLFTSCALPLRTLACLDEVGQPDMCGIILLYVQPC